MKIAIISDIHCHEHNGNTSKGGYYYPLMPEFPVNQNPFASLKQFIRNENLNVDYLLSPGDYSHQIDPKGLKSAWDQLKFISHELNAKYLIGTIGNHDVESRSNEKGPFKQVKIFDADFPVYKYDKCKELKNNLLTNSYFYLEDSNTLFLTLNSSFDHWDTTEARNGKIDKDSLNEISEIIKKNTKKYIIVLVHHHPIVHETGIHDTMDLIKGSEEMIKGLQDVDLIIHGHKHDFRFTQQRLVPKNLNILSAGSFACYINARKSMTLNSFQIINFCDISINNCINPGIIESYTYDQSSGWKHEEQLVEGFGSTLSISDVVSLIKVVINNFDYYVSWNEIVKVNDELKYISSKTRNEALILMKSSDFLKRVTFDSYTKFPNEIIIK